MWILCGKRSLQNHEGLIAMLKTTALLFLVVLLSSCNLFGTKSQLARVSRQHDPATMQLEPAFNDYVRRTFLPNGAETGLVDFKDGSQVKYWFQSHHRVRDKGGAWFEFEDGQRIFVTHLFCCEVQLSDAQPENSTYLLEYLKDWNEKVRQSGY